MQLCVHASPLHCPHHNLPSEPSSSQVLGLLGRTSSSSPEGGSSQHIASTPFVESVWEHRTQPKGPRTTHRVIYRPTWPCVFYPISTWVVLDIIFHTALQSKPPAWILVLSEPGSSSSKSSSSNSRKKSSSGSNNHQTAGSNKAAAAAAAADQ